MHSLTGVLQANPQNEPAHPRGALPRGGRSDRQAAGEGPPQEAGRRGAGRAGAEEAPLLPRARLGGAGRQEGAGALRAAHRGRAGREQLLRGVHPDDAHRLARGHPAKL